MDEKYGSYGKANVEDYMPMIFCDCQSQGKRWPQIIKSRLSLKWLRSKQLLSTGFLINLW